MDTGWAWPFFAGDRSCPTVDHYVMGEHQIRLADLNIEELREVCHCRHLATGGDWITLVIRIANHFSSFRDAVEQQLFAQNQKGDAAKGAENEASQIVMCTKEERMVKEMKVLHDKENKMKEIVAGNMDIDETHEMGNSVATPKVPDKFVEQVLAVEFCTLCVDKAVEDY